MLALVRTSSTRTSDQADVDYTVFSDLSSAPSRSGKGPDARWTKGLIELVVCLLRRRPGSYEVGSSRFYGRAFAS